MPGIATLSDSEILNLVDKPEEFLLTDLPSGTNCKAISQRGGRGRATDSGFYYFADETGYAVVSKITGKLVKRSALEANLPSAFTNLQRAVQAVRA